MARRIFIGIKASKTLQAEIINWRRNFLNNIFPTLKSGVLPLKEDVVTASIHPRHKWRGILESFNKLPLRWITPENLHITLIPPWNEEDIVAVRQALSGLKNKVSSFEIIFNNVSFGPNPRRPRLIWAEGEDSRELVNLKRTLEKVLRKRRSKRILRPHITLARFRSKDFHSFQVKKLNEQVLWRELVNSFCLYESRTFPSGAKYKIIEITSSLP